MLCLFLWPRPLPESPTPPLQRLVSSRPMEMSAKRPVPVLRQVVTARKPVSGGTSRWLSACSKLTIKNKPLSLSFSAPSRPQMFRDPRFDDLSGEYKPEIFEKTYKFIDDIRSREKHVRNRERRAEGG